MQYYVVACKASQLIQYYNIARQASFIMQRYVVVHKASDDAAHRSLCTKVSL
jgi:hypothetical protein